ERAARVNESASARNASIARSSACAASIVFIGRTIARPNGRMGRMAPSWQHEGQLSELSTVNRQPSTVNRTLNLSSMRPDRRIPVRGRRIARSDHLPSMQDVAEKVTVDAEPFRGFVDWQSFADDQADRRPVNRRFVSIAFMRLHGVPQRASRIGIVATLKELT